MTNGGEVVPLWIHEFLSFGLFDPTIEVCPYHIGYTSLCIGLLLIFVTLLECFFC